MQRIVWYNSVVAVNPEKKTVQIGVKIPGSLNETLEDICAREDRPLGYVARELMVRGLGLYRLDGKLREEKTATFDLDKSMASDDPYQIMSEWFTADGYAVPRDLGVIFFEGWETFSPEQKRDALVDAKRVIGRKLEQKPKGKVVARIEPGSKMSKTDVRRMLESDVVKPIKRKAR